MRGIGRGGSRDLAFMLTSTAAMRPRQHSSLMSRRSVSWQSKDVRRTCRQSRTPFGPIVVINLSDPSKSIQYSLALSSPVLRKVTLILVVLGIDIVWKAFDGNGIVTSLLLI